ncbi:MAG: hypothetical protein O9262_15075 [Cyclobacteriaceae bacterium]|jgi:hypothetical protein|nr:hypothetical protein [Cyclobacteriaceae bacterium]
MQSLHKAKNIEITYDAVTKIMICNWVGFQNKESIMASGNVILDLVKKKGITKVLNDNTHVTGPWQEAAEWTAKEWFPAMIAGGLKHFAWIFSSNIFAEMSAKKAMPASDVIKSFGSYREASEWLMKQS